MLEASTLFGFLKRYELKVPYWADTAVSVAEFVRFHSQ